MNTHSFAIKVCGITRQSDLSTAMGMGAHFCGFIFHPGSPRYIAPSRAAALDSALIRRVGVFVNQNAEEIMDIMKTARLEFAQLHGAHSLDCARRIGPEKVIRVLWPDRYESLDALQKEMELWAEAREAATAFPLTGPPWRLLVPPGPGSWREAFPPPH